MYKLSRTRAWLATAAAVAASLSVVEPVSAQSHALLPKAACVRMDRAALDEFLGLWGNAYAGPSLERLLSLYAPDAVVIGLGTKDLTIGHDKIQALYARQKSRQQRPHFAEVAANFTCNTTVAAGTYSFLPPGAKPEEGRAGDLR